MNRNIAKLKLLLAGMGLSRGELRRLLLEISHEPIESLVDEVEKIACYVRSWSDYTDIADERREVPSKVSNEANVGVRVERLLRQEASLSSSQAYKVLSSMLVEAGVMSKRDIPPLSKKALHVWVNRVLLYVPAKDLLRLATIARNNIVHKPRSDWSLG